MMLVLLLRLVMTVIFGSLGNFLARSGVPPNAPIQVPTWTGFAATLIFSAAGFFSPEIFSFLAKAGIVKLAQELPKHIPTQIPKNPIKLRLPRKRQDSQEAIILDTSAIVDGRIFEIIKTGFLKGDFVVIPQVLEELHHLSDSKDDLKRARGRLALDLLNKLKKEKLINLKIQNNDPRGKTVDEKLLELAKKIKAKILTCDYNLGKVAKLKNVPILNVNELAIAIRVQVLPGEELTINLIHIGKTKDQAVGYLSDGTMVVVEDGAKFVGRQVQVKVHRSLQTAAGRMVFAKTPLNS